MTSRVYKSAQGQMIDVGALALKNENVLAVSTEGKINARGDRLDGDNRIVDHKSTQIQRQIQTQTQVVSNTNDIPPAASARAIKQAQEKKAALIRAAEQAAQTTEAETVIEGLDVATDEAVVEEPAATSNEGLAAAIAKAKSKKAK